MNETWRPREYVYFPPAVRHAFGAAVLVGLLVLFSMPWAPEKPLGTIPATSPFLQERYHAPATDDRAILIRIAGALDATGHKDDARLAQDVWQRSALKRLLGEPHAVSGDIAAALRAEAADPESIDALGRRVLARVSLRRLEGDTDPAVGRDSLFTHFEIRMSLSNGLAIPVTHVMFHAPEPSAAFRDPPSFDCMPLRTPEEAERQARAEAKLRAAWAKPRSQTVIPPPEDAETARAWRELQQEIGTQKGAPIAPGASAPTVCRASVHEGDETRMTEAALRGNGMPGPIAPVAVNADDLYLFGTVSQRDPVDYFGEGRDAVRAADCRALATCDAKRLAWMEELGLRIPQLAFAALMLVIAGLARYAASRMTARVEPPENGFVTLLCGFTYAAWVLLLLEVYWVLNPHVGIAALFFGNALIETGLVVAGSGILLGGAMAWDRQHATRLRVFTLVMVPIALACGYVAAFRCGVSPYTLTVVCR